MVHAGPNYHFDGRHTEEIPAFYAAQRSAFMQPGSAGAFIWSLKNSVGNDVWSFEGSLRNGWLGNPAGECPGSLAGWLLFDAGSPQCNLHLTWPPLRLTGGLCFQSIAASTLVSLSVCLLILYYYL